MSEACDLASKLSAISNTFTLEKVKNSFRNSNESLIFIFRKFKIK